MFQRLDALVCSARYLLVSGVALGAVKSVALGALLAGGARVLDLERLGAGRVGVSKDGFAGGAGLDREAAVGGVSADDERVGAADGVHAEAPDGGGVVPAFACFLGVEAGAFANLGAARAA